MHEPLVQELGPSLGRSTGRFHQQYALSNSVSSLLQRIPDWIARHRERNALAELSDHLLEDIGVSHEAALREAAKPFWR
jgi:uncharacterized protein YjiS (DUF1127 family)